MAAVTGTGSLTAGGASISAGSEALGHLSRAAGFLRGVQILAADPERGGAACHFLAGWTLESTLKAYLAHCGKTKKQLDPIRHDLEALWREATAHGLAVSAAPPSWCELLNSIHYGPHDHRYHSRYPTDWAGYVGPSVVALATDLQSVFIVVEAVVSPR